MTRWKTVLYFALGFAALGWILASLLAPTFVKLFFSGVSSVQAMCNCQELIDQTTHQFLRIQGIGFVTGLAAGLVAGIVFARWRARKAKEQAPVPAAGK
jgi:hypothetical protein